MRRFVLIVICVLGWALSPMNVSTAAESNNLKIGFVAFLGDENGDISSQFQRTYLINGAFFSVKKVDLHQRAPSKISFETAKELISANEELSKFDLVVWGILHNAKLTVFSLADGENQNLVPKKELSITKKGSWQESFVSARQYALVSANFVGYYLKKIDPKAAAKNYGYAMYSLANYMIITGANTDLKYLESAVLFGFPEAIRGYSRLSSDRRGDIRKYYNASVQVLKQIESHFFQLACRDLFLLDSISSIISNPQNLEDTHYISGCNVEPGLGTALKLSATVQLSNDVHVGVVEKTSRQLSTYLSSARSNGYKFQAAIGNAELFLFERTGKQLHLENSLARFEQVVSDRLVNGTAAEMLAARSRLIAARLSGFRNSIMNSDSNAEQTSALIQLSKSHAEKLNLRNLQSKFRTQELLLDQLVRSIQPK